MPEGVMDVTVRVLHDAEIAGLLPQIDALGVMRSLFRELGDGRAAQPPQTLTLFPNGTGDFITYLGVLEQAGVFGAKLSPYIVTDGGGGVVTAWTVLMSMRTGQPLLWCDAKRLTTERTAATTALAVDLLAPASATRLAVIGAGAVAQAHVRQAVALRAWSEIRCYSRTLAERGDHAAVLRAVDTRVAVADSLAEAVEHADVVMLCTSSATPVLDPAMLARPALITSISTNAPRAHEVPPASLLAMDVYCDARQFTPQSAGEMQLAAEHHGWDALSIAGDLAELVRGRARMPDGERHVFFRSIGLGLEDVAMAHAVHVLSARSAL
jgi:L-arginine dehydrogenase